MANRKLALVISLGLVACAPVRKEQIAARDGVVLPNSMCAKRGQVAASNDRPGERMICEMEEVVGSHLPKCICRDELAMQGDRERTQDYMDEIARQKQMQPGN